MGERSFEVGEFDSVRLEGAYLVVVHTGEGPSVRAEGDSAALDRLDVRTADGTLTIRSRRLSLFDFGSLGRGATVYVGAPGLERAQLAGSGSLRVDRIASPAFEASVSGSGGLRIEEVRVARAGISVTGSGDVRIDALEADRLEADLRGSGGFRAAGTAEDSRVTVKGSGSARLGQLQTRRTSVAARGSGSITVHASEMVDGSLRGSGSVIVHGPARCSISRKGSGQVRCRD